MPKAFVLKINGRLTEEGRQFLALLSSPDVEGVTIDDFTLSRAEAEKPAKCKKCNGTGEVISPVFPYDDVKCPECN